MKSPSPFMCPQVICLLVFGVVLSAGCIFPQTMGTSRSPSYDTPVTTIPATQQQMTQTQGTTQAPSPPAQNTVVANCRSGLTNCGGFCRDLLVDIGNCGECGVTCPYGQVCTNGQCVLTCPKGKTVCSATCADLTSDPKNCGACGIACPSGQVCTSGQCSVACINNLKFCNGYCRDLTSDSTNCGACGIICPSGQTCRNGQCLSNCVSGQTFCNGYCRNLYTDSANCGSCGVSCAAGSYCQNGMCIFAAAPVQYTTATVPLWGGSWSTSFGAMTLTQNGNSVSGSYTTNHGTLYGTTNGNPPVLTGIWYEGSNQGPFEFDMSANGAVFTGWYSTSGSVVRYPWNGNR